MRQKKMLLVFNPRSGKGEFAGSLFDVIDRFTKSGWLVTAYPTQAPRNAYEMILQSGTEYDCVVCSGGDGTVSEAVDALMALPEKPVFGCIPSGTTNDFASSLNLPRDILQAAANIAEGIPFAIDVGKFGGGYFSYVAAFGMFTDVTYDTPQGLKNLLGHAAYILESVKRLGSIQAHECKITADGETFSGHFILALITNSTSVGGFKVPQEDSVLLDDGLFELLLLKKPRRFVDLQNIVASLLNRELYTDSLIVRKASKVRVVSKQPLNWTLDGEFGGSTTDVLIENQSKALEILVPKAEIIMIE